MHGLQNLYQSLLHLCFPHICEGCSSDSLAYPQPLCLSCRASLPETNFHLHANNPVEKIFWGRLPLVAATALLYFTKGSVVQELMHGFKYKGNRMLGSFLGEMMGHALNNSNRFTSVDALVPLPLFSSRERKRGFNQAKVLCEGIASVFHKPVLSNLVARNSATETQTHKGRVERWQNMEGRFELMDRSAFTDRHILLVDDVVTTGATLEACGRELLQIEGLRLSIATLCFASGN